MRLVYKDFPLNSHELAMPAHEAARCAGAQGRYWAYHDRLYDTQPRFEREQLVAYAIDLGLDRERFTRCLDDREFRAAVEASRDEGLALGVRGTPTFLINGTIIRGAAPFEQFETVIEAALNGRR